jgi:hypothetical protein
LGKLRVYEKELEEKNFYARYKIFGSSEVVASEIKWDQ